MNNIVYNNSITNSSIIGKIPNFPQEEEKLIFANIFEQLLLFDKLVLNTDYENYTLSFLISKLGLATVERLIASNYINFSIKSSVIFTSTGKQKNDGTIDTSSIYSQPPIVGGVLSDNELDPETNIYKALRRFNIDKSNRNRLIKIITPKYIKIDNMKLGVDTTKFIIDSYTNNTLAKVGLPFLKDPFDLDIVERQKLLELGHSILEAGIINKNGFKSYNNYNHLEIVEQSFENIGKAYHISENVSEILRIENTPDLKEIYLQNSFNMSDIFKLRHLKSAKYFRKWINEVGENSNAKEVTEAYIAEIKNAKRFFDSAKGKIIKHTVLFGATAGLGGLIAGSLGLALGAAAKTIVDPAVDYGLGMIEEFTVDRLLEGKNPKIFIDKMKEELKK
ncbi:hypothetical protein zobellia_3362 [Sporocytophaga myxococcoides]|uniref:Uncharacterized protein n=1 Tax=Sporocytophaga myxococcoides TaxID=153721 RepID=A0A098LAK7_9BACT|nr:hypothetical protein [Sporocytophaga myxococcoides]GAL83474.1 hypothetical protein zobellia_3362 [Sporocytophaga myxococcoides]